MMMRIGIIGAMQEEIDLIRKDLLIKSEETIGMRQYYSGELYGQNVVLVFSRWGKVASASTVTTLIERFQVDLVLFTGVAGAANTGLNVGDIVIADVLVQHDMDISPMQGFAKFDIPLLGLSRIQVEPQLVTLAQKSADFYIRQEMEAEVDTGLLAEFHITVPRVVTGIIASGDQFIADKGKINTLVREIDNLQCVEMEGAAVAQVCYEHGVKFVVFRVISDKADEHANINFSKFIDKTASYLTKGIIRKFVKEIVQ